MANPWCSRKSMMLTRQSCSSTTSDEAYLCLLTGNGGAASAGARKATVWCQRTEYLTTSCLDGEAGGGPGRPWWLSCLSSPWHTEEVTGHRDFLPPTNHPSWCVAISSRRKAGTPLFREAPNTERNGWPDATLSQQPAIAIIYRTAQGEWHFLLRCNPHYWDASGLHCRMQQAVAWDGSGPARPHRDRPHHRIHHCCEPSR
jgi:hypothetical protein